MTAVTFLEYLKKIFYPFLCGQGVEFPVILFVDGHTSHFSFETSEFCAEKKIVLVALHPNSTHLIQPMDVAVFGPLKTSWRAAVYQWKYKNNNFKPLTKEHFAGLLHNVIDKHIKPEYSKSGFRTCGLFPFNSDSIDYAKLVGNNFNQRNDEDDIEAIKRENERKKFAVGFDCMRTVISDAKEIAFFEFYSSDNSKPWGGALEDTTAYYIWREMFQRSRDTEITSVMEELEEDENRNEAANLQNELITEEEIYNWDISQDPNVEYFDTLEDMELVFENPPEFMNPTECNSNDGRLINVLDDFVVVPSSARSSTPVAIQNSKIETHAIVDKERQEATSAGSEVRVTSNETSNFTTQQTAPEVSLPALYDLPTTDAPCPIKDVFLQCLNPQSKTTEIKEPKQKFRVPKITGEISLHFTSANESHYISCIDFSSDTTVVSGKWHREFIQKQKDKHQLAAERRLQRQKAKISAEPKTENPLPLRQSARAKAPIFVFPNTPLGNVANDTDEDSDFVLSRKNKKKKKASNKKPSKPPSPYDTPNLDTSFSSGSSFSPKPKKYRSKLSYTTDEN